MRLVRIVGIAVVILVAAIIALPFLIDANQFRPMLQSELSKVLGREVTVGNLKLELLSGGVSADDLAIADDPVFSQTPFVHAKSLKVGVEMWPLIVSRKINVIAVTIDQPEITLLQTPAGAWNYANLGSKSAPAASTLPQPSAGGSAVDLSVNLVKLSNGRLTIAKTSGHSKPLILDSVNIELKDFSPTSVMPFSLAAKVSGGGDIKLDGKAGPIRRDNLETTPFNLKLTATHLDLVSSGAIGAAAGIGGLVSIDGSVDSNGSRIAVNGRVKADRLTLVKGGTPATRPVEVDFAVEHDLETRTGTLKQGDVRIGKATATLAGTYIPRGESMALKVNLSAPAMAVGELEGLLPALNIALPAGASLQGGTAFAKLNVEGPLENLAAAGTLGLNDVRITGFDLGSKLSVMESLAGIQKGPNTELQKLSADVKASQQETSVDNIQAVAQNLGDLTGSGTISPNRALDFKMRVHLSGYTHATVPFFVHGTSSDPKFEPDLKGLATDEIHNLKDNAGKLLDGIIKRGK